MVKMADQKAAGNNKPMGGRRLRLGRIMATADAAGALERLEVNPLAMIARHARGDWGAVDDEDRQANELAIDAGCAVMSVYPVAGVVFYVVTAGDRRRTVVMLGRSS